MTQKTDKQDIVTIPNCGKSFIINDTINWLDQYDIDSMFHKSNHKTTTEWPDHHSHFYIDQYLPTPTVVELGDVIIERIKQVDPVFPKKYKVIYGSHEIRHHEDRLGGIAPHSDRGHYIGVTLFMNKFWNKDWGAWNYVYNDNDGIDINIPTFNRTIVLYAPRLHGCTPVWERDKVRRSLQFFVDSVE